MGRQNGGKLNNKDDGYDKLKMSPLDRICFPIAARLKWLNIENI